MNFQFDIAEPLDRPEVTECKGMFFRGYRNVYAQGEEYHMKQGFRLLKRKSCTGCDKCNWYKDSMNESLENVIVPDEIKNGGLYSIHACNFSRDWETGYVDDYDLKYFEVEE